MQRKSRRAKPFKHKKVLNIAVSYNFEDGQSITILFHHPDREAKKIAPQDTLISWKILMNSRDITGAVQPNQGEGIAMPVLAGRIMKLVNQNSARFKRTQAKKAENVQALADAEQRLLDKQGIKAALEAEIQGLLNQLDEVQKNKAAQPAEPDSGGTGGQPAAAPEEPKDKSFPPIEDLGDGYYQAFKNDKKIDSWTAHLNTSGEWEVSANNAQTRAWNRGIGAPRFFNTIDEMIAKYPAFGELAKLLETSNASSGNNGDSDDADYLNQVIKGEVDFSKPNEVETKLEDIGSRLTAEINDLFEQAVTSYSVYQVGQASQIH